jgi:hypothetical protein
MYYVQGFNDEKSKFSCKGIQHKHNSDAISFNNYKNVVLGQVHHINVVNKGMRILNDSQINKNNNDVNQVKGIYTYQQTKLGLSSKYDKRIVLSDGISTVPLNI